MVRAVSLVGADAVALWLFGLSWARSELTDGAIPREVLPVLHPLCGRPVAEVAAALVASGLWAETEEGWKIAGFEDWNPNGAKTRAKLEKDAARKREWRAREKAKREAAKTGGLPEPPPSPPSETKPVRVASAGRPTGRTPDEVRIEIEKEITTTAQRAGAPERTQASSAPEPSRVPSDPLAAELLAKLEATPPLAPIAAAHHAETLAGRCHAKGTKAPAALAALDDLARDAQAAADAGSPWGRESLASKAAKYIDHARAPSSVRADASRPYQRPPPSPVQQGCDLPAGTLEELLALTEREASHGAR